MLKLRIKAGNLKPGASISAKLGALGVPVSDVIKTLNADSATKYPKNLRVFVELIPTTDAKKFSYKYLPLTDSSTLKMLDGTEQSLINHATLTLKNRQTLKQRIKELKGIKKSLNVTK